MRMSGASKVLMPLILGAAVNGAASLPAVATALLPALDPAELLGMVSYGADSARAEPQHAMALLSSTNFAAQ